MFQEMIHNPKKQRKLSQHSKVTLNQATSKKKRKYSTDEVMESLPQKIHFGKVQSEKDFIDQLQKIGFQVINSEQINKIQGEELESPQFGYRLKTFSFKEKQEETIQIDKLSNISNVSTILHESRKKLWIKLKELLSQIKLQKQIIKQNHQNLMNNLTDFINVMKNKFSQIFKANQKLVQQNKQLKKKLSTIERDHEQSEKKQKELNNKIAIKKNEQFNIIKEELRINKQALKQKNTQISKLREQIETIKKKYTEILKESEKKDAVINELHNSINNSEQIKKCFENLKQELSQQITEYKMALKKNKQSSIPFNSTQGTQTDSIIMDIPIINQSYFQVKQQSAGGVINNQPKLLHKVESYNTLRQTERGPFGKYPQLHTNPISNNYSCKEKCLKNIEGRLHNLMSSISEEINLLKSTSNKN